MIYVTYRPDSRKLSIKGHAGAGEKGHDLVCAAASTVFYTLCQMLLQYDQEKAFAKPTMLLDKPGSGYVQVWPRSGYETWIDHDMLFALSGYQWLMKKYPDYLNLKVLGH